ncbi:MAG: VOC family protein [Paludibacter sp.]|nr:VOC family protein [Paludibacter sp.]
MKLKKIDHIGVVVNDLVAAKAFFLEVGLEVQGEAEIEGEWVDRVVGLNNVKSSIAVLRSPDGGANIELIKYHKPTDEQEFQLPLANTVGIRNIAFTVDDIEAVVAKLTEKGFDIFGEIQQYEGIYKLCYIRGPEGIILMLAEELTPDP